MSETDLELLERYSQQDAEEAFGEVVRRHVDLVYSAALRQVRAPELAEEVAQSAFLKLAKHARELPPQTIISAWLYQVTRREAIDVVRRETRRQSREQIASEMNATLSTHDDWANIAPLLDEAVHTLDGPDRAAVLMRFFENKSLREVGEALGTSDDAAQKRVSRAVDRLREFFDQKGVSVGTAGLTAIMSANAVHASPPALTTGICASSLLSAAAVPSPSAIAATKTIAMTTLQKTAVTTALVAAIGFGVYEAQQVARLREELKALRQQRTAPSDGGASTDTNFEARINSLSSRNDELVASLGKANAELTRLRAANQEVQRSAQAFKELAERAGQKDQDLAKDLPTLRHVFARFGNLALRAAKLKGEDISQLSEAEKKNHEDAKMSVITEMVTVLKAGSKVGLDDKFTADTPEARADYTACMLFGALGLDERQFNSAYDLLRNAYQEAAEKNLLDQESSPEVIEGTKLLSEKVKSQMGLLLNAEQNKVLTDVSSIITLVSSKASIAINF